MVRETGSTSSPRTLEDIRSNRTGGPDISDRPDIRAVSGGQPLLDNSVYVCFVSASPVPTPSKLSYISHYCHTTFWILNHVVTRASLELPKVPLPGFVPRPLISAQGSPSSPEGPIVCLHLALNLSQVCSM